MDARDGTRGSVRRGGRARAGPVGVLLAEVGAGAMARDAAGEPVPAELLAAERGLQGFGLPKEVGGAGGGGGRRGGGRGGSGGSGAGRGLPVLLGDRSPHS